MTSVELTGENVVSFLKENVGETMPVFVDKMSTLFDIDKSNILVTVVGGDTMRVTVKRGEDKDPIIATISY